MDRLEERLDHPPVGDVALHVLDVHDVDLADHVDDAVGPRAGGLDQLPQPGLSTAARTMGRTWAA